MDLSFSGFEKMKVAPGMKVLLVAVIVIAPIWYLDIYFLAPGYYNSGSIEIPILISLTLGWTWFFINALSFEHFNQNTAQEVKDEQLKLVFSLSFALFYLCLLSYLAYLLNWGFLLVVNVAFGSAIIRFFINYMMAMKRRPKPIR